MIILEQGLTLEQRQIPQIVAVEVKQVEGDHHDLFGSPLKFILQHGEVRGAVHKVEGNRIKLTEKDSGEGSHKGHHRFIDKNPVAGVEGNKVRPSAIGAVAVTMEEEK